MLLTDRDGVNMKRSGKIAFSGMVSALCILCMLVTGVFPYATYALPAIAAVLLTSVVIEAGKRYALSAYVAVSVLSLILTPDIEAKLVFIVFLGYYPVLKAFFEGKYSRKIALIMKVCSFNVTMIASYFVVIGIFRELAEEFVLFGVNLPIVFLFLGNIIFLLLDRGMDNMIGLYIQRLHPIVRRTFGKM